MGWVLINIFVAKIFKGCYGHRDITKIFRLFFSEAGMSGLIDPAPSDTRITLLWVIGRRSDEM